MTRFFVAWEFDRSKMPNEPKEKMNILMNLLNEGMEAKIKGLLSDWESFSNLSGYFVINGTDMEVMQFLTKYSSYLKFSQPTMIVSLEQAIENYTKLAKMVAVAPKQ